ncbi:MAG: glycosyltransferase family 2 protein [Proteobacteria bacterium]|nr:glycosyltransferase family 2 protein [Pseudomonadota bacterium]
MTYILDLQRLWETNTSTNSVQTSEARKKNVVSVIVVCIANEKLLLQVLQSVLAQQYIREVIIVNGEEAPSLEVNLAAFTRLYPKCHVVTADKKAGLAAAFNLGASHASGQFLLFVNGNCILPKHAVNTLLATGIRKPTPWVVGGAQQIQDKPAWGRLTKLFNALDVLKYEKNDNAFLPEVSLPGGGFHTSSLGPECLFLSAQSFLELKGLDRKCFHSTFHVDLCLRVHFAGGGVYRAKEVDLTTPPQLEHSLRDHIMMEWQALCGRYHFYKKHVSANTSIFLKGLHYGSLVLRFMSHCAKRFFTNLKRPSPSI